MIFKPGCSQVHAGLSLQCCPPPAALGWDAQFHFLIIGGVSLNPPPMDKPLQPPAKVRMESISQSPPPPNPHHLNGFTLSKGGGLSSRTPSLVRNIFIDVR